MDVTEYVKLERISLMTGLVYLSSLTMLILSVVSVILVAFIPAIGLGSLIMSALLTAREYLEAFDIQRRIIDRYGAYFSTSYVTDLEQGLQYLLFAVLLHIVSSLSKHPYVLTGLGLLSIGLALAGVKKIRESRRTRELIIKYELPITLQ